LSLERSISQGPRVSLLLRRRALLDHDALNGERELFLRAALRLRGNANGGLLT
jgi:hypothetical protein